jgi:hypothetical protein
MTRHREPDIHDRAGLFETWAPAGSAAKIPRRTFRRHEAAHGDCSIRLPLPKVLIADEPSSALDVTSQKMVIKMLKRLMETGSSSP